jgi:hypothetical protein
MREMIYHEIPDADAWTPSTNACNANLELYNAMTTPFSKAPANYA